MRNPNLEYKVTEELANEMDYYLIDFESVKSNMEYNDVESDYYSIHDGSVVSEDSCCTSHFGTWDEINNKFNVGDTVDTEIVNKVEVKGNERISAETILIFGDIIIGKNYHGLKNIDLIN